MRALVQFLRDLVLLPRMWRSAADRARRWAEYDRILADVEVEHPSMPSHQQRRLAHRRQFGIMQAASQQSAGAA